MDEKQLLNRSCVFQDLSDSQLDRIAGLCRFVEFDAGETITSRSAAKDKLYVIERGSVALQMHTSPSQEGGERRLTIDIVKPTETFGWCTAVGARAYAPATVCLEETRALEIDGERLRLLLEEEPAIGYLVLRGITKLMASREEQTWRLIASERAMLSPV